MADRVGQQSQPVTTCRAFAHTVNRGCFWPGCPFRLAGRFGDWGMQSFVFAAAWSISSGGGGGASGRAEPHNETRRAAAEPDETLALLGTEICGRASCQVALWRFHSVGVALKSPSGWAEHDNR